MTEQIPSLTALSAISFFYPNMARNPAEADMFAYISQLSVKLKYVEDVILTVLPPLIKRSTT